MRKFLSIFLAAIVAAVVCAGPKVSLFMSDGTQRVYEVPAVDSIAFREVEPTSGTVDGHEWVDLGLSSGTCWATCNVGADAPEQDGSCFAWGETMLETKATYSWDTYLHGTGPNSLVKYCLDESSGQVDGKTVLEAEDDAAVVNWGENWCMPSRAQFQELLDECTWEWTTLNGKRVLKATGPNGNALCLPAAGYKTGDAVVAPATIGYYWSNTLDNGVSGNAWCFVAVSNDVRMMDKNLRWVGRSVRPVLVR